jgi:WD40 repeat protein
MESGVHILRCQVVAGEEHPDERGSRSKRHKGSSPGSKGYNFKAVLEVMGQEGPCSKTFVDSQSRILCLPSYDGGVRLYLLPQWITDCGEIAEDGDDFGGYNDDDGQGSSSQTADVPEKPKIYPSSTLYDDAELVVQGEGSSVSTRHRVPITALTMSNDCKSMVTGSNDALIKLWDVTREEIVHRFEGHEGFIWNVKTLDPELNTAVSTSTDGYARRWDLRQRKCTGRINVSAHGPGNIQAVTGVALRGNGHHLAAGSLDCNIYVLDLRMMKRLYIVGRHDDKVCRAHLYDEGDSNLLVRCSLVRCFVLASRYKSRFPTITHFLLDHPLQRQMTTGWDRTVRLWEFN